MQDWGTTAKRIAWLLDTRFASNRTALADALDMTHRVISRVISGKRSPGSRLLRTIIESYGGGPVGLDTIATSVAEESETVEDVHEPYLIQCGLLARTSRGRIATDQAYRHLGLESPGQQRLF